MFNRNMENHPGQQCNHKNYMVLVLVEQLENLVLGMLLLKGVGGWRYMAYGPALAGSWAWLGQGTRQGALYAVLIR
jgi:hypothetical protein